MSDLARWDYQASVKKMRPLVIRWKTVTEEMLDELYRAREALAKEGRPKTVSNETVRGWSNYLSDIGLPRATAHRWLEFWNPIEKKRIEPPPKRNIVNLVPPEKPKASISSDKEYARRKEEAVGGNGQGQKPDVEDLLGRIEKELTRKQSEEIFTDFDLDQLIAELKERILRIPEISRRHEVISRIIKSMKELAIECDRLSVGRG